MMKSKILILLILSLALVGTASAWPTGYLYCQTHQVQGSTNWANNNSIVTTFEVYNTAGTSVGNTLYLNGHSTNFPNDILFTNAIDTPLYRQVINMSNLTTATYAQIYVNLSGVATSGNTQINIYYGNSTTQNPDNPDLTFLSYDNGINGYPFNKSTSNPIATTALEPSVFKNGTNYWMYTGTGDTGSPNVERRICSSPISCAAPTTVLAGYTYPAVYFDAPTYRMVSETTAFRTINLSTSYDGSAFTNQGLLVAAGAAGQRDSYIMTDPAEIHYGGTYYLYYAARNGSTVNYEAIFLATSATGLPGSYTKQGIILDIGAAGSIDSTGLFDPTPPIQYDTGKWIMFYTGFNGAQQGLTYALATDPAGPWTKIYDGYDLWKSQTWEAAATYGPNEPDCLIENGLYQCWYRGNAGSGSDSVGYFNFTQNRFNKLPITSHKPWNMTAPVGTWSEGGGFINQTDTSVAVNHYLLTYANAKNVTAYVQMAHTHTGLNNNLAVRYAGSTGYLIGPAGVPANVYLFKYAPAFTSLNNTASAQVQNFFYNYKLTAINSALSAWKWDNTTAEPINPTLIATDTAIAGSTTAAIHSSESKVAARQFFMFGAVSPALVHSTWTSEYGLPATPVSASFTQSPNPSTVGQEVTFTDTSTGTPSTWNWSLTGSSVTNTTQNAAYTYSAAGTYTIFLNVTGVGSMSNTSAVHTVVNVSSFTEQDIDLAPIYRLTVRFTDSTTNAAIPVVIVTTSDGQTNTTTNGEATFYFPYSVVVVYASATGYVSTSHSYVMDSDRDEVIQMTPAIATPALNTWYSQKLVKITVVNTNGVPLIGANTSMNFLASSLPNTDISWIQSAFGVTALVAEQMQNSTLTMTTNTGDDGAASFMVFPGFRYGVTIVNTTTGLNHYTTIHPSDSDYIIYCPTVNQNAGNQTQLQLVNTTLFITEPNMSYVTFNFQYQDTSSLTTSVTWNVTNTDNMTPMYYRTFASPGTNALLDNYTVPNVRGQQWKFFYNATRSAKS